MSTYRLDDGPVIFVRIRSRDGAEGWGEAAASPIMGGETLAGMKAAIDEFVTPRLVGAFVEDRAALMQYLRRSVFGNGGAFAAVDIALLDLAGRQKGVPAVDLLGGPLRHSVEPLWLIGGSGVPEKDVETAVTLRRDGFRKFKLKVGLASISEEVRAVRLLREALGEESLIGADANMGWSTQQAIRFAREAAPFGLAFLEQPVAAGDLTRMVTVAKASPVPIGIDESMHGASDILAHHALGGIGGASLKTIKLGGITPLVALGSSCHLLGLSVNLAMMMESSLASAAMIHAACALPQLDWGLSLGHLWLAKDPVGEPIACQQGVVRRPSGPGLGIEMDERRVRSLAPS
jgi:muconate cycloisomerase